MAFSFIFVPLLGLFIFSVASGISFNVAIFDLSISLWRIFAAFVIATILAWIAVVLLVRGKTETPALAFFDLMQSLPTFTILPIAVHYLGTSETTIVLFLVITIIWPIIFSIVSSIKQANQSWKDAIVMSRIRHIDYVRYYLLPLTAPGLVTGAIIGLGDGWEALIATEIILEMKTGLGAFFQGFSSNSTETLIGILIFLSIIFSINKLIWLPLLEKSHALTEQ